MNKKKRKKVAIILCILALIIATIVLYYLVFYKNPMKTKVVDEIAKYNYTLDDRDTKLMVDEFNKLKEILDKDKIDYEEYAKAIAKIFVIDLYTIDNKINPYDVGGIDYVHPDHLEQYKTNVKNTLYSNIGSLDTREDKFPVVKSIKVLDTEESTFMYGETEYPSYEIKLSWTYEKDLKYDKEGYVTIMKIDDKLYVASISQESQEVEDAD